jgi:hypothetical protein
METDMETQTSRQTWRDAMEAVTQHLARAHTLTVTPGPPRPLHTDGGAVAGAPHTCRVAAAVAGAPHTSYL